MSPPQNGRGRGRSYSGMGGKPPRGANNGMNSGHRPHNGNGHYPQQPYYLPYAPHGMPPHMPPLMHHHGPSGPLTGPPSGAMAGNGQENYSPDTRRVVYTDMPLYAYSPGMDPPPGPYAKGGSPQNWQQNGSQGARSSSGESAHKGPNAYAESEDQPCKFIDNSGLTLLTARSKRWAAWTCISDGDGYHQQDALRWSSE